MWAVMQWEVGGTLHDTAGKLLNERWGYTAGKWNERWALCYGMWTISYAMGLGSGRYAMQWKL